MQVRMVEQVLAPGMEDRDEADASAEVFRISSDGLQCFGSGLKQDVVDHRLVLVGDRGDLLRHREHHVEVRYRQQIGLTVVKPLCTG